MSDIRQKLNRLLLEQSHNQLSIQTEEKALVEAEERAKDILEAQKIVQEVAENIQEQVHRQIASVVTRCLQTVFMEEAYTFKIDFMQSRGKTEARLLFVKGDQEFDPLSSSGGGVIDVAAFALRLACLLLSRYLRRILFLDEPFRFVSRDYQERVRELLESLTKDLDLQIVMVTHNDQLTTGKIIEVE